jgi:hypothetical protein
MIAPTCQRCHCTLTGAPLSASIAPGATVFGGAAPYLYNGVVCQSCGKVECINCKTVARQTEPCSWCGGAVAPAYEHLVGIQQAAAPAPRRGLRWSDLLTTPLRFLFVMFFLTALPLLCATFAAWGICGLVNPAPATGPFISDQPDRIYWVESHTAPATASVLSWTAWATGLVLCALLLWRFEWAARIVELAMRDSGKDHVSPAFAFPRIEVAAYRVLFAVVAVVLLPLPLCVSFADLAAPPPEEICSLTADGMHLVGRTAELDDRGNPQDIDGQATTRSVAWKKVATIAFEPLRPNYDVLSWTDAAGKKELMLIEKHVSFARDEASRNGWNNALARFAPHVKLISEKAKTFSPQGTSSGGGGASQREATVPRKAD